MSAIPLPHPSRLSPERGDYAEIIARHEAAIAAGQDEYLDPSTGRVVQTVVSLQQRSFCCDCGCRHCPFIAE